MPQEMLHGDLVVVLVLDEFCECGVVEDSGRAEDSVLDVQIAPVMEHHDADRSY